jgi:hypothetical protein
VCAGKEYASAFAQGALVAPKDFHYSQLLKGLKMVQNSSKKVQKGSKGLKRVQKGSKGFKRVQKGSKGLKRAQKGVKRVQNIAKTMTNQ